MNGADITKCTGEGCPFKENCWRYKAPSSDYDYLFDDPPFDGESCRYYWEYEEKWFE